MPRATTPESRAACARHAASTLFQWDHPENAPADWTPSADQVIARTKQLYSWVEISEDEAFAAIRQCAAQAVRS